MTEPNPDNPDYQVGAHDIDKTPSLGGEDDFIEFQFESAAIFKRLADDIYESDEAGIREPLSNSITAVRRAEREHGLENGVIEITLEKGESNTLHIRDNGVGISKGVLEEVLAVIGRSTNRDDGGLSGKYGMGFLACYKLVGTDGGFIMHTCSRKTDEQVSGIWKPGGFDMDTDQSLVGGFDEGEYGTELVFPLKDGIRDRDIREWVENHAYWSRVPVVYREFDQNGSETFNEDYGTNTLAERYDEGKRIVIDNDYFTAVASPNAQKTTLLLDSPISRNARGKYGSPWRFDIRLKNENGIVVDGPHEGLMPVSEEEYRNMDEERQERFIPESQLVDEDVTLPSPIGTRDKLERGRSSNFWNWLGEQMRDHYQDMVAEKLDQINSYSDFIEADESLINFVSDGIKKLNLRGSTYDDFQKNAQKELGVTVPESAARVLNMLERKVIKVERNADVSDRNVRRGRVTTRMNVGQLLREVGYDGQVYMGVTLNQEKCNVVWEDHEDNEVIVIDNSNKYDEYQKLFGWKKVKKVSSNIDEFDVSDDLKESFKKSSGGSSYENAGKDAPDRKITVHTNGTTKREVGELYDEFEEAEENEDVDPPLSKLVLFPSNAKPKISDNNWISSSKIGAANSTVKVWDYMKDLERVTRIEDFLDAHKSMMFRTSEGKKTIPEITEAGEKPVFHVVSEQSLDLFHKQEIMEGMSEVLIEEANVRSLSEATADEVVYIPVTADVLDEIRAFLYENDSHIILQGDVSYNFHGANTASLSGNLSPYMKVIMPEWRDVEEVELFSGTLDSLDGGGLELAETLKLIYDADMGPVSEDPPEYHDPLERTFETHKGEMTVHEMLDAGTPFFHLLDPEVVERFKKSDADIQRLKEYVAKNAHERFHGDTAIEESCSDEIIYVPTTKAQYEQVSSHMESPNYIRGKRGNGNEYRLSGRIHEAYAYARLPDWEGADELEKLDSNIDTEKAFNLVDTLAQLHDAGMDPASARKV